MADDFLRGRRRGIACLFLLAVLLGGLWVWVGRLFPLSGHVTAALPTLRLFAGDEEFAVLPGLARLDERWRPLEKYPRPLVEAVLLAEDRRF